MSSVLIDAPADGVARITMNRPEVLNALNRDLLESLTDAFAQVERDDSVGAVVLTGAGRAFSAGFDLKEEATEGAQPAEVWVDRFREDWQRFLAIWRSAKPYVAAVRGYNLGGALELSLLCDVTVAGAESKFGAPEIRHASGPGACMLPWLVGMKAAKWALLTGEMIDAERALQMGIVTEVVADDELDARAVEIAANLALIPSDAMKLNKLAINRTYERLGMLTAIEDNYMISTVVNATSEYLQQENERRAGDLKNFVAKRDKPFSQ
ncbi:MAG TPA: enoyl-CoA hydratase/isomerase family protein [Gaiellaceae bacterium]|jgi:enoyl-CoA hydratase/carnithine racemase